MSPGIELLVRFVNADPSRSDGNPISEKEPIFVGYHHVSSNQPLPSRPIFLMRELKKMSPDVILLTMGYDHATTIAILYAARFLGIPLIWRHEGNETYKQRHFIKQIARKTLLKWLYRDPLIFASIGTLCTQHLIFHGVNENRIFLSPYNVDESLFQNMARTLKPQRIHLRATFGIPENAFVFLFPGKFAEYKNPLHTIRAFQQINTSRNIQLIMVGAGPLEHAMRTLISQCPSKKIILFPHSTHIELCKLYTVADAMVLPSQETWGRVVNEAQLFELPVIVSNLTGCHPDLVPNNTTGFVVPVHDEVSLRQKMEYLVHHPEHAQQLGTKGTECVKRYSTREATLGLLRAIAYATQQGSSSRITSQKHIHSYD